MTATSPLVCECDDCAEWRRARGLRRCTPEEVRDSLDLPLDTSPHENEKNEAEK